MVRGDGEWLCSVQAFWPPGVSLYPCEYHIDNEVNDNDYDIDKEDDSCYDDTEDGDTEEDGGEEQWKEETLREWKGEWEETN